jgi:hypothetical protein
MQQTQSDNAKKLIEQTYNTLELTWESAQIQG